jgi:AcrR family transcriptional regulator
MVRQERAVRTRQSLIRAAAEVFAEEGFGPASLTAVSRRAGVSNGALHFHFASKQALAQAIEDQAAETFRRIIGAGEGPGGPQAAPGGALQRLVDVTHQLIASLAQDVVVRVGFSLRGDVRWPGRSLRLEWQRWVEQALRCAEREGRLAAGVSAGGAARTIAATTVGLEVLGGADPSWLTDGQVAGFWELLLPGLADEGARRSVSPRPTGGAGVPGGAGGGGGGSGGVPGGGPSQTIVFPANETD